MIGSGAEAADRKQRIRDRYKGVDTSELEVIPAKTVEGLGESTSIRRVAAYVRVSTDNDEQTSSYELQKNYYTDYIKAQPGWEFVGIYDDEGISGTSLEHRKGMQQLIEDCKAGKIDLILTKSIARFARNIVDCLSVIETLKNLDPPVGVKFEADNIYTLDSNGRMNNTYRLEGKSIPRQQLVSFDLGTPFLVENGKALDENPSPTKPLCGEELSSAESSSASPIKRDSGAL